MDFPVDCSPTNQWRYQAQACRIPPFSFAYQPIIDVTTHAVVSYEALIRGPRGQRATSVLAAMNDSNRSAFEQSIFASSISLAARLGLNSLLNVNCLPSSFVDTENTLTCLVEVCRSAGVQQTNIVLEITEQELCVSQYDLAGAARIYQRSGLKVAIDDFGAGHSGLNRLAEFPPNMLKIDMHLVRNINQNGPKQAIIRGVLQVCQDLGIDVVIEGVETLQEYEWCLGNGIEFFQGFLFAEPGFERFPSVTYRAVCSIPR